ncbi:MAG: hypothetical protein OEZ43_18910 [Gammaproteobacteria bacterium]|nr:hypothetical protein [Gammaproteobacteria bacterium]
MPVFPKSEYSPEAIIVEDKAQNGKTCRIVDNTGSIPVQELAQLLGQMIEDKQFGIKGLSDSQGNLRLREPRGGHIQINGRLYRMIINTYEAILDEF